MRLSGRPCWNKEQAERARKEEDETLIRDRKAQAVSAKQAVHDQVCTERRISPKKARVVKEIQRAKTPKKRAQKAKPKSSPKAKAQSRVASMERELRVTRQQLETAFAPATDDEKAVGDFLRRRGEGLRGRDPSLDSRTLGSFGWERRGLSREGARASSSATRGRARSARRATRSTRRRSTGSARATACSTA